MCRKTKIYLDTSVISHLDAEDMPDRMAETLAFWQALRLGLEFDVFVSDLTNKELLQCHEPKRTRLIESLSEIIDTDATFSPASTSACCADMRRNT